MRQYDPKELESAAINSRVDLYFFSRWMFAQRKGFKWLRADHHRLICDALMRVYEGKTKRLIINILPDIQRLSLL